MSNFTIVSQLLFVCADPAVQKAGSQLLTNLGQVGTSAGVLTDEVRGAWKRGAPS